MLFVLTRPLSTAGRFISSGPTPTALLWDIAKAPEEQNKAAASTTRPLAEPVVLQSPLEFNVLYSQ